GKIGRLLPDLNPFAHFNLPCEVRIQVCWCLVTAIIEGQKKKAMPQPPGWLRHFRQWFDVTRQEADRKRASQEAPWRRSEQKLPGSDSLSFRWSVRRECGS